MAAADRAEGLLEARLQGEVGDDHDRAAVAGDAPQRRDRAHEVRAAAGLLGRDAIHGRERGDQAASVGARRAHLVDLAVAAGHHAEAVAAAAEHHAEPRQRVAGEVHLGLGAVP